MVSLNVNGFSKSAFGYVTFVTVPPYCCFDLSVPVQLLRPSVLAIVAPLYFFIYSLLARTHMGVPYSLNS